MTRLDRIQAHLALARQGYGAAHVSAAWYADDVAPLLRIAQAALAYRDATQIPDGVQAAEQALFKVLDELERSI